MPSQRRVLFVCTANAARSQMAEAILRHLRPQYEVFSAGTAPAQVDARAVRILEGIGMPAEGLRSKSIDEFKDQNFDYIIALCNKSHAECQVLPNTKEFMAWDFADPQESDNDLAFARAQKEIQQRIQMFLLVTEKPERAND